MHGPEVSQHVSQPADFHSRGEIGNFALWVGFIALLAPTVFFYSKLAMASYGQRFLHFIAIFVTGVASLAYLVMAFGFGTIELEHGRPFYWVRYLDWIFANSLVILELGLVAGVQASEIFGIVGWNFLYIGALLIGGLVSSHSYPKWAFWGLGVLCLIPVLYGLLGTFSQQAKSTTNNTNALYSTLMVLTVGLWAAYPLVWVMCQGLDAVSTDVELVLYTILDVGSQALFGIILLSARSFRRGDLTLVDNKEEEA